MRTVLSGGLLILLLLTVNINGGSCQVKSDVCYPRLCGTWKLEALQNDGGLQRQHNGIEFRLLLQPDGRLMQGLYPDGMSHSHWNYDPMRRMLTIYDGVLKTTDTVKLVALGNDVMVLEATDTNRTVMFYRFIR